MNAGKMIFSQLTECVPHYEFQRLVAHYQGDYKVREFSSAVPNTPLAGPIGANRG
jgi:hypothetical protein